MFCETTTPNWGDLQGGKGGLREIFSRKIWHGGVPEGRRPLSEGEGGHPWIGARWRDVGAWRAKGGGVGVWRGEGKGASRAECR